MAEAATAAPLPRSVDLPKEALVQMAELDGTGEAVSGVHPPVPVDGDDTPAAIRAAAAVAYAEAAGEDLWAPTAGVTASDERRSRNLPDPTHLSKPRLAPKPGLEPEPESAYDSPHLDEPMRALLVPPGDPREEEELQLALRRSRLQGYGEGEAGDASDVSELCEEDEHDYHFAPEPAAPEPEPEPESELGAYRTLWLQPDCSNAALFAAEKSMEDDAGSARVPTGPAAVTAAGQAGAAPPAQQGCRLARTNKYSCPDCNAGFASWGACREHLRAVDHAGANIGMKGVQQRCQAHALEQRMSHSSHSNQAPAHQPLVKPEQGQRASEQQVQVEILSNRTVELSSAESAARRWILRLLSEHSGTLLTALIPGYYQQMTSSPLDYKGFGYAKLQQMLESIPGVNIHGHSCTLSGGVNPDVATATADQVTGTISTQTVDGIIAVEKLRTLSLVFNGRKWPASKNELSSAFRPKCVWAILKPLATLWKSSGCLSGKGTKKNKFVWNKDAVQRVLGAAPVTQTVASQQYAQASIDDSLTSGIEYVDTVDKLEAAVQVIMTSVPSNAMGVDYMDSQSTTGTNPVVAIGTKSGAEKNLSLVQLAISESAGYLFDCTSVGADVVVSALAPLCGDPAVTKLAFDIHRTGYALSGEHTTRVCRFAGAVDIQLAIELLTSDPSHSMATCVAQLQPERAAQRPSQPRQSGAGHPSYDVRPLPASARKRAVSEIHSLLGVWPRLLEAVGSDLPAVQEASDLRAASGASSTSGSRRIVFDVANSYAIASPELMQVMRPGDVKAWNQLVVSNDTGVLLDLLPTDIGNELRQTDDEGDEDLTLLLSDIVLDKGRPACAWVDGTRMQLGAEGRVISIEDIDAVLNELGGFGSDNRAGLEQQLHRISGMRNRDGDVIGLTMRVGRHVSGNADMISDLLFGDERSILFLGEPGSGKTTIVREATRLLSMESNVCVVDTSNEIAGDGDVPHPCIGLARRMMVPSLNDQAAVMVECVQNHTPEIMVIDEIGRPAEVEAARTCKQRGVRMIASAHGDLRKLVKNKQLRSLVGGVESVTLGDAAAKAEAKKVGFGGMQKVKAQRSGPPTFDIIVELRRGEQHEWRIIMGAGQAVDVSAVSVISATRFD
jgi:stage III sporulation protein SpoIIIAA